MYCFIILTLLFILLMIYFYYYNNNYKENFSALDFNTNSPNNDNYVLYNNYTYRDGSKVLGLVSYDGYSFDGLVNKITNTNTNHLYDKRIPVMSHLEKKSKRQINTFGSSVPLRSEHRFTEEIDNPITPFINRRASPLCCTNTYIESHSTSTGCLCPSDE